MNLNTKHIALHKGTYKFVKRAVGKKEKKKKGTKVVWLRKFVECKYRIAQILNENQHFKIKQIRDEASNQKNECLLMYWRK